MKKVHIIILLISTLLAACGGSSTVKPSVKPKSPVANKPAPPIATKPNLPPTLPQPSMQTPSAAPTSGSPDAQVGDNSKKPGGYYLDDGPGPNPPTNIDDIPNASPKPEPLLPNANRPYKALGATYTPLTASQEYKARGIASWYGRRFHGKKTSSGEIYDMYGMTAAHPTLPLPSYVKVSNPANGRWVIVRVNDRGPFKSTRIIDLSYAAAYKLRLVNRGSGLVEIEALHPNMTAINTDTTEINTISSVNADTATGSSATTPASIQEPITITPTSTPTTGVDTSVADTAVAGPIEPLPPTTPAAAPATPNESGYYVQAGAFKYQENADVLKKKIQDSSAIQKANVYQVYNGSLHRLWVGPFPSRQQAEQAATDIAKQLSVATIIINNP